MNPTLRYGALFAGYGGLELGVQAVLGGSTAWHSEIEPAACRILEHHWPDVPNVGDITAVDWDAVEPIDVLTGGFPCQDVSHAGKRLGLKPGTRSGLWSHMAYAIDKLRPRLVVAENVRGLLSAQAGGDLEPCPWCVGDSPSGALRALGAVLGDLADLGYDATWIGVRAADAGAPHGRFRVFVFAWPADAADAEGAVGRRGWGDRPEPGRAAGEWDRWAEPGDGGRSAAADAGGQRHGGGQDPASVGRVDREDEGRARERERVRQVAGDRGATVAADADDAGRGEPGRAVPARAEHPAAERGGAAAACGAARRRPAVHYPGCRSAAAAAHADRVGRHGRGVPDEPVVGERDQVHRGGRDLEAAGRGGAAAADPDRIGEGPHPDRGGQAAHPGPEGGPGRGGEPGPVQRDGAPAWGPYAPAVDRWAAVIGRTPPSPTEVGAKGQPRLAPAFVEWLMGLPAGHVTGVPGVSRNDQLKALGNGVVPQQAALATMLWARSMAAEHAGAAA